METYRMMKEDDKIPELSLPGGPLYRLGRWLGWCGVERMPSGSLTPQHPELAALVD
jgi:hypothetical protein